MARLFENRDVRFFSLQKYDGARQLQSLPRHLDVIDLGEVMDETDAFVDTAAVMCCLDIIITVDTALAHLAGALGRETWTLLPFVPDFRWGLGDAAFYPTMRLFRQSHRGDWTGVITQVESALSDALHPARYLV
jgi:ADP-heptose:LPS heptosyltransferase